MSKLAMKDVRAVALSRYSRKNNWKAGAAAVVMLLAILAFGVPAMVMGTDFDNVRTYESHWGETVIVSGSQVTIEGIVLDRVDEQEASDYIGLQYMFAGFLFVIVIAGLGYLVYWINSQSKYVDEFLGKWMSSDFEVPEE